MSQLFALVQTPLGIVLTILGFSVLIFVHEGGHFLVARACGMRVDRFSIGFGPPMVQWQRGETHFQIGWFPLGGFVQIAGLTAGDDSIADDDPRAYPNRPVYQRALTIFAGPATNYLFAVLMMMFVYGVFGLPVPIGAPMVTQLLPDRPAVTAGIQLQDELLSIDGKEVKTTADVSPIVDASGGKAVSLVIRREGHEKAYQIVPARDGDHWRIGVGIEPREVWQRTSFKEEMAAAIDFPIFQSKRQLGGIWAMITRQQKPGFQGPLGIGSMLKHQISRGAADGLGFIGLLSVLIGLFNLLPIPALDGGRLVFLFTEGLARRKVIPERVEQTIHAYGLLALLSFIVLITFASDLPNLFHH